MDDRLKLQRLFTLVHALDTASVDIDERVKTIENAVGDLSSASGADDNIDAVINETIECMDNIRSTIERLNDVIAKAKSLG
jgi:hypothetical protein